MNGFWLKFGPAFRSCCGFGAVLSTFRHQSIDQGVSYLQRNIDLLFLHFMDSFRFYIYFVSLIYKSCETLGMQLGPNTGWDFAGGMGGGLVFSDRE